MRAGADRFDARQAVHVVEVGTEPYGFWRGLADEAVARERAALRRRWANLIRRVYSRPPPRPQPAVANIA